MNTSQAAPALPEFLIRAAERAIEDATHPKGMHTNGPAIAQIEASKLAAILRHAQAAMRQAVPDTHLLMPKEFMRECTDFWVNFSNLPEGDQDDIYSERHAMIGRMKAMIEAGQVKEPPL